MKRLLVLAAVGLALASCQGGSDPTTTPAETTATSIPPASAPTTSTVPAADPGGSPLESRVDWLADVFNRGELAETEFRSIFTSDFLDNVTHSEFLEVIDQLSAAGSDWSVGEFEEREGTSATVLIVSSEGEAVRANITLETVVPYRIAGLLLQPAEPPALDDPPADLEAAAARLAAFGEVEMAVFDVTNGDCEQVFQHGDGSPRPVGSAIKLYVLAAVADAVAAGEIAWDDEVAISEELKSIPTGVLQDEEEGETFSVREVAETMIAFSDNTGTDHLIDLVRRDAVESALAEHDMADPSLNIPFMDTMDLTALKLGPASGLATQWLEGDEATRRQLLDQISDIRPSDIPLDEFDEPILVDQLEWFATTSDMCRVLVDLAEMGEPVTQIMSINPGVPDSADRFDYIAFKGGSEPGLVAMNWLVERPDGRRLVLSGSVVNADEDFDQLTAVLLFGAARDLLADL